HARREWRPVSLPVPAPCRPPGCRTRAGTSLGAARNDPLRRLAGKSAVLGRFLCHGGPMRSETTRDVADGLGGKVWAALVERIRGGDPSAVEELYGVFSKGVRFLLWRQLGHQDLDDRMHDIFLMVVQSIQRGELREPERLMGYVRTVVRRQTAGHIEN